MLPTAGFIPPPVVPLVPAAANAIVPTGGALVGAAAAAATGAKYGAALGPKGLLAGAVIGGAVGLLLAAPAPLAPGTLPALDPGLNDGDPSPQPHNPINTVPVPLGEAAPVGSPELQWRIRYLTQYHDPETVVCKDGRVLNAARDYVTRHTVTYTALGVSAITGEAVSTSACSGGDSYSNRVTVLGFALQTNDGEELRKVVEVTATGSPSGSTKWTSPKTVGATIENIERGGVTEPVPDELLIQQPEVKPRPSPVPIPSTAPPVPRRRTVPRPLFPDPAPAPDPMVVPSPDNPDAPPITIPKAPPAPPQEVPGPERDPLPERTPRTPRPVPPPLPIPRTPTVPEPTPDPQIFPAPGPAPGPRPVPNPNPSPDPGTTPGPNPVPQPVPTPITPGTPGPGPITTPITPEDPTAVDPETGLVPQPDPQPVPTPPGSHFPVSGGPAVTPGGARSDLSAIAAEVGRIEQKTARLQNGQGGPDLSDWLWLLPLLQDFFEGDIPGTTYDLQGVCESVSEGQEQPIAQFPVEPAKNLGAIINRLDVMQDIFQQHLAWRTPTCKGETPQGEWRTVHFISDEPNGAHGDRVLKRFRYRSLGGGALSDLIDHWSGFAWAAGPVIVKHRDAWWGTPQVWAASGDEGKRVIRHAAGEAGIDPDQVGRWEIGGTSNPRYGLPGTMRVNRKGGYWWITARDGPSERPIVGTAPLDL